MKGMLLSCFFPQLSEIQACIVIDDRRINWLLSDKTHQERKSHAVDVADIVNIRFVSADFDR